MIISLAVIRMIRLSVNVLESTITLLEWIDTYHFSSMSDIVYSKIASISAEDIFNFASECGWVSENESIPFLTRRGYDLLNLQKQGVANDIKKQMLADYVLKASPIWSNRIPYGRSEAAIFMTKDEKVCFVEAGLLSERLCPGVINWWDTIANRIRERSYGVKNDIGRIGEMNTIKYERIRTEFEPKWMAVESNLVGYDVKSQQSKDDPTALLIEVKTSNLALSEACFHVTSNEWSVALTCTAYVFHLWCLHGDQKLLAVITPDEVYPYIPTNNLEGEWESTSIPFSCFKNKFVDSIERV